MVGIVISLVVALVAAGALVAAAVSDLKSYTIPNACSFILIVLFPVAVLLNGSFGQIYDNLIVFAITLVIGYGLFVINSMGAGDAKLLAAMGLWAGFDQIVMLVFMISVMSLFLVVFLVVSRHVIAYVSRKFSAIRAESIPRFLQVGAKVPLGVAIAVGGLLTLHASRLLNLGAATSFFGS